MREIRYRAWDKTSNLMRTDITSIEFKSDGSLAQINVISGADILYPEKEAVLMQYTGLKDKNGVEIYEGDVVEKSYPKSKPQRRSMVFAIEYKELFDNEMGYSLGIGFDFHSYGSHELEVIGNIYENPELLEDKK